MEQLNWEHVSFLKIHDSKWEKYQTKCKKNSTEWVGFYATPVGNYEYFVENHEDRIYRIITLEKKEIYRLLIL
tara:strand:- start:309 stop:527 length:219 start_codon:yes stop_codon:yes gene_type:complete